MWIHWWIMCYALLRYLSLRISAIIGSFACLTICLIIRLLIRIVILLDGLIVQAFCFMVQVCNVQEMTFATFQRIKELFLTMCILMLKTMKRFWTHVLAQLYRRSGIDYVWCMFPDRTLIKFSHYILNVWNSCTYPQDLSLIFAGRPD